ncbi:hypothetical protein POTOM_056308 [Populus tomentosa]|uniref:Expansin-like EG45 domain-containing protein n=1 Tax=Populus tomentosa TaxID=118781 RepID=A0A8X8C2T9_POPTO|nr:hypothetical protein POTOM_056308 [Populus tomentosa]
MGFNIGSALIMVGIVSCLVSVADAAEGIAYMFLTQVLDDELAAGNSNDGVMIAGVSDALWNGGAACGTKYRVSCVRGANQAPRPCGEGSVVVTVVDFCSKGCNGIINLSLDAFSRIADPDAGKVVVRYDQA